MTELLFFISILLLCIYCILIFRWNVAWSKIPEVGLSAIETPVKITVIIPVRNEESNIFTVLNSLLNQSYPKQFFEIIVSDDHSNDATVKMANDFFSKNFAINGKVIKAQGAESLSKKEALKNAIEIASGELIITTDADCVHHKEWLLAIASYFISNQPVMICGPVIMKGNQSFLQQFQMLDYLSLQASGASSLALSKPLLCSGANLAFTKNAFYEVGGYDDNLAISSGDDTFLMLKMQKRFPGKVQFLKSEYSIVSTICASTLREFLEQRFRWVSKTKQYENSYIKLLGFFLLLLNLVFVLLLIAGLSAPVFWLGAIFFLLAKTTTDYCFLSNVTLFFGVRFGKLKFMIMELVYPFYLLALFSGFLRGFYHWKQRRRHS